MVVQLAQWKEVHVMLITTCKLCTPELKSGGVGPVASQEACLVPTAQACSVHPQHLQ